MNTRDPALESAAEAVETPRRELEPSPGEALGRSAHQLRRVIEGQTADIEARKWAEGFLAGEKWVLEMIAKARFEGILAIAEDAIISVDSSQHIVLFNRGAGKVFGYAETEVIGKPLDILLPQRFAHAHRGHLEQFAASAEVSRSMGQRREVFGRRRDGSEFPAEASISKLDVGSEVVFTVILRDITERKRAAEALRASEHLARGQLDALTRTLNSLAQESDPDKLLEHVLRTIAGQSGAHSLSVWDRDDEGGRLRLVAVIEDDRFQTRNDAVHPVAVLPIPAQNHPVWSVVLRTGQHAVLEDVDQEAARMRVGSEPDAPWHPVMEDTDPDPAVALLKKHLRGLGVCAILAVPMLIAGRVAGIIAIRFKQKRVFRREEIELTRALAHQAMLALQLMRLARQSRQVAVAAERNRLARDIHDTLAQGFTGVIVQLEAAEEAMSQNLAAEAAGHLGRAGELARESLREARRSLRALRPQALEEKDLRICQEVLANTLRHARAKAFKLRMVFERQELRLNLRDDGAGFDPAGRHDGFGLQGIRERAEGLGGQLSIQSAKGEGTAVSIVLPFARGREPAAS